MMKCNQDYALKTAIELAKANIESTDKWVDPEYVNDFIEAVYGLLRGERKTEEE